MPVADRYVKSVDDLHKTIASIEPKKLDSEIFEEIHDLIERVRSYEKEEKESQRKIKKLEQAIEHAEEVLTKAKEKKDVLTKRNEQLRACLESRVASGRKQPLPSK